VSAPQTCSGGVGASAPQRSSGPVPGHRRRLAAHGPVRIGVTVPTFCDAPVAIDVAHEAEGLGIDGVFVFDHVWPMGRPDRPALAAFPMLGAIAAETTAVCFGPLVARVGLVPDPVMVARLRTLDRLAPGRLVAGLGTGDAKGAAENAALGVPMPPMRERLASLDRCARALAGDGIPVWLGGRSAAVADLARRIGAAVNLWDAPVAEVAERAADTSVTWAGPLSDRTDEATVAVQRLADAGAQWVVWAWPSSLEEVAVVARTVRGR
jgi:alkanesulfonate monooxygenase SsuD/methylene tetrahydromethanopterin reductase-like flavin-dependent oxidoreductase (luciferase family)